ncbi:MAG TPA: CheR family methyltransferase [Polyangia bacterium]|nr:CheR family methyltransferase [Polyangia bacterium]
MATAEDESEPKTADFLVVGVGASAGGLDPLERLFAAVPDPCGMAFVVLQHLSPDFESRMDELLGRQTTLTIHRVTDGIEVQPNAIYLIPPRKEMIISGGRLLLSDKEEGRAFSLPIDHFFRSLAHDIGRRAVGIVLSGAGSDGSRGIREIHEAGGLVLCQTPETARFQSMPLSAQQSNVVDRFLAPQEMPHALAEYARDPGRRVDDHERHVPRGAAMDNVLALLRTQYGIDFAHYKPSTVTRRIERRVAMTNQRDLGEYAKALASDPDELNALYKDLLIGVTRFFRDPDAFETLQTKVVPHILERVSPSEEIRVWSAACATGEEVYSLAILFHEALEAARRPINIRLFATDVHRASIDTASAGLYDEEALSEVTPERRARYFVKDGERYRVSKELRQLVVFAQHNLITDAPFTRVDLVTCRNLLIYFQPMVQRKVLSLLHFGLKTGGMLLLGPSETPGEIADEFDTVDSHWRLYSKRRDARLPDTRLPLTIALPASSTARALNATSLTTSSRTWSGGGGQLMSLYDELLDRVMPPSLLVDEHYQLVHAFGGAESVLRIKGGRASNNVLDLVGDNIKTALLGALQHANKARTTVRLAGIPVQTANGTEEYRLRVEPLGQATGQTHFLIQYENKGPTALTRAAEAAVDVPEPSRDYVSALESELRFTKESLQATIEELETANEELQATNEELVASNEELQSTNEELHSVNEELYTVNVEHQRKITQLGEMTDDLDNLLHSIDVGVLFLDDKLCIRKYTAQVANVFRLLPQDVGRRFDAFAPTIQHPGLEDDVLQVSKSGQTIAREVTTRDGVFYLLRVLPYRSTSQKSGVVLTLIDISALKRTEATVRRLSSIVETSTDAITSEDLEGKVVTWNRSAETMYGFSADEVRGREMSLLMPAEQRTEWPEVLRQVQRGESREPWETTRVRKDGSSVDVQVSVSPVFDEHDRVIGVSSIARDISQRRRDEMEIRRSLKMRDQFMAMLSHELRNPLAALLHASAVLKDHYSDADRGPQALKIVERQCKHMARLLDDLLDVSRMRQVGVELRRQRVDLHTTIEAAVERVRPLAESRAISIEVCATAGEIAVFGDPDRLQQIEVNLLTNAIKYSPESRRVWLHLEVEGDKAVIKVKDEGNGIQPELLDKIFEPFVRAVEDDSHLHQPQMGGMGLGLAVVRSFVRAHGGDVRAESDGLGKGAMVVVTLPLAASAADGAAAAVRAMSDPQRLVLVEDQEDSRLLLQTILEDAGYSVAAAADGQAAVDLISRERPAIALVDIGLPIMNGYEVARRIRRLFGPNDIFLVALTGYGQQQDREAVMDAGFDQHIVKPIDASSLIEVLHSRQKLRAIDMQLTNDR